MAIGSGKLMGRRIYYRCSEVSNIIPKIHQAASFINEERIRNCNLEGANNN